MTKARIEIIKRKRNAMQKFLKKDFAELLKDGLDVNAYGRRIFMQMKGKLVKMILVYLYVLGISFLALQ